MVFRPRPDDFVRRARRSQLISLAVPRLAASLASPLGPVSGQEDDDISTESPTGVAYKYRFVSLAHDVLAVTALKMWEENVPEAKHVANGMPGGFPVRMESMKARSRDDPYVGVAAAEVCLVSHRPEEPDLQLKSGTVQRVAEDVSQFLTDGIGRCSYRRIGLSRKRPGKIFEVRNGGHGPFGGLTCGGRSS
jgi:hypothetical protein